MATQNIKVIERKPLRWWEKLYLPQVLAGMKITLGIMLRKPVTLKYPFERPVIPKGYRGVPTLVKDQNGREKCVSCQLCEFVSRSRAQVGQEKSRARRRARALKIFRQLDESSRERAFFFLTYEISSPRLRRNRKAARRA